MWEIAIKAALKKPGFTVDPESFHTSLIEHGYLELVLSSRHVMGIGGMPPIHKDPFDRLLIAQATGENMMLVTGDEAIASYPGPILRV